MFGILLIKVLKCVLVTVGYKEEQSDANTKAAKSKFNQLELIVRALLKARTTTKLKSIPEPYSFPTDSYKLALDDVIWVM